MTDAIPRRRKPWAEHTATPIANSASIFSLETIDAAIKLTLECANLIERAYLTMALKVFLQTIGKRKGCRVLLRGMRLLDACSQKQRRKRHGNGPESRCRQPPVEREHHSGEYQRRSAHAENLRHSVREQALLIGAVLHDNARQIGQIAPSEKRERKQAQTLRDGDTLAGAFLVDRRVRRAIFPHLRDEHHNKRRHNARCVERHARQANRRVVQIPDKITCSKVQHHDGQHQHQVRQRTEPSTAHKILHALIGQGKSILNPTPHGCHPLQSSTSRSFGSLATCAHTVHLALRVLHEYPVPRQNHGR